MRLRVAVRTTATSLPWENVLRPGRGLVYELLSRGAPEIDRQLHEHGWGETGMPPLRIQRTHVPVGPTWPRPLLGGRDRRRGVRQPGPTAH